MSSRENKPNEPTEKAKPAEVETVVWVRPSGCLIKLKATKEMEAYATGQGWEREGAKARK